MLFYLSRSDSRERIRALVRLLAAKLHAPTWHRRCAELRAGESGPNHPRRPRRA